MKILVPFQVYFRAIQIHALDRAEPPVHQICFHTIPVGSILGGGPGFEPGLREPQSRVLPLHYPPHPKRCLVAPRGFFQLYSRAIGARTGFLDRLPHCRDRFLSPACLATLHHGAALVGRRGFEPRMTGSSVRRLPRLGHHPIELVPFQLYFKAIGAGGRI